MTLLSDLVSEIRDLQSRAATRSTAPEDQPTAPIHAVSVQPTDNREHPLWRYFSVVALPRVPLDLLAKAAAEAARQETYYPEGHTATLGELAMCDSLGLRSVEEEADGINLLGPAVPGEKRPMEAFVTAGMYVRDAAFAALLEARLGGCWAEPPQPRPEDLNPTGTGKPSSTGNQG